MSDSAFLKLITGNRISNYMGLEMDSGVEYTNGLNYLYLTVPAREREEEVKRNMHVFLEAACQAEVRGRNILLVEPNPALAEYGSVQGPYMIHPQSGKHQIGFWFTAHKQLDLSKLDYLARLYLYT